MTRMDAAVDVNILAGALGHAHVRHMLEAQKVLRYLKGSDHHQLAFKRIVGPLRILTIADAAFQNLVDCGSQGGQIICLSEVTSGSSLGGATNFAGSPDLHSRLNCCRKHRLLTGDVGFESGLMRSCSARRSSLQHRWT